MNNKLFPFIVLFILIIFKFIWQYHVIVNEIYMFSLSYLKIVTNAYAYLETNSWLMIITNVNLITKSCRACDYKKYKCHS